MSMWLKKNRQELLFLQDGLIGGFVEHELAGIGFSNEFLIAFGDEMDSSPGGESHDFVGVPVVAVVHKEDIELFGF